jgi:hypothetical protein
VIIILVRTQKPLKAYATEEIGKGIRREKGEKESGKVGKR